MALKYRPRVWGELIGNDMYIQMLKNTVIREETKNAYFFSGVRGSGKTTTVRIFAKALQCSNQKEGDPCNECNSCKSIDSDSNMDVLEIDAASENKVDSIRELIRSLNFAPVGSKYKIIILDECHMLSNAASNALLKTLEEPPEYVIMLFCTTDPDKVIDTIISRCLRFDFRRLATSSIEDRLTTICTKEALTFEKEALKIVAESVNGAMRDAITILDQAQLIAPIISSDIIQKIIGFVSFRDIYKIFEAVAAEDLARISEWFEETVKDKSHIDVILSIISFLEQLVLVQAGAKKLKIPDDLINEVKQMSAAYTLGKIVAMSDVTRVALADIRRRNIPDTGAVIHLLLAAMVSIYKEEGFAGSQKSYSLSSFVGKSEGMADSISRVSIVRRFFDGELVKVNKDVQE